MRQIIAAIFVGAAALSAGAQEISSPTNQTAGVETVRPAEEKEFLWHVELKQKLTDRGTTEESKRTTLRLEATPDQVLSLIRVDIPFIEEKNGEPTSPRLGDILLRFVSQPLSLGKTRLAPLIETTFPTAEPESLGGSKYQLGPGAQFRAPLWTFGSDDGSATWKTRFDTLLMQVFSVAGDPTRKDLNYTRFEPELSAEWKRRFSLSLTTKFVFDWEQSETSGLMLELEGGWNFGRHWRAVVTLGKGLMDTSVPTGYAKKLEFSLRYNF